MSSPVYSVPVHQVTGYRDQALVIRADDVGNLIAEVPEPAGLNIAYIQLPVGSDTEPLGMWGIGIPVDIVLEDPAREFAQLYRHGKLLDKHPMRVSIPVKPGFLKSLKIAASLQFAVKLMPGQPEPAVIPELLDATGLFLHRTEVAQPVEFFHSLLLAFYHAQPLTLWSILEEHPLEIRYVDNDGSESISPRRAAMPEEASQELLALTECLDCRSCAFLENCQGYFKWPDRQFDCGGVRQVLGTVRSAAFELRAEMNEYAAAAEGLPR